MLGSMEFLVYLGLVGILVVWFILPLVPAVKMARISDAFNARR